MIDKPTVKGDTCLRFEGNNHFVITFQIHRLALCVHDHFHTGQIFISVNVFCFPWQETEYPRSEHATQLERRFNSAPTRVSGERCATPATRPLVHSDALFRHCKGHSKIIFQQLLVVTYYK